MVMPAALVAAGLLGGVWLALITVLYLGLSVDLLQPVGFITAAPALETIRGLVLVALLGVAVGVVRNRLLTRAYLFVLLGLGVVVLVALGLAGHALALTMVCWIALVSWAGGERLLKYVVPPSLGVSAGRRAVFAVGVGLGCLSHLVLGLGLLGLVGQIVYVSLLAFLTACLIPELRGLWRAVRAAGMPIDLDKTPRTHLWLMLGLVGVVGGWLFVVLVEAVAPEIQYDAVYYHLGLPHIYLAQGRVSGIPYNTYSYFYLGQEMLFLLGMGLADQAAAKLINVVFYLLVGAAVIDFGWRAFSPRSGLYSGLLILTVPLFARQAATADVDLAMATYVFLATAAAYWWWRYERAGWLVVAGAMAGFALSTKLTALMAIGPLVLLIGAAVAWRTHLRVWRCWREVALFSAAFLAMAAPWPVVQYAQAGNPAFPFLNGIFKSPYAVGLAGTGPEDFSNNYLGSAMAVDFWGIGTSVPSLFRLPWAITFNSARFMENTPEAAVGLGLVCLPLLILTASIRHSGVAAGVALALLCGLTWAFSGQAIRYGMAMLVPVYVLAGHALAESNQVLAGSRGRTVATSAIGGLVLLWGVASLPLYLGLFWNIPTRIPYAVAYGRMSIDEYVSGPIATYKALQFIRDDSGSEPPTTLAITIIASTLYAPGKLLTNHYPPVWPPLARTEPDAMVADLRSLGLTHVLIDKAGPVPFMADRLVTRDAFLDAYLELRYANQNIQVYRIPTEGETVPARTLHDLLIDGAFENQPERRPRNQTTQGWSLSGSARVTRPRDELVNGLVTGRALRLPAQSQALQLVQGIQPGTMYAFRYSQVGEAPGSAALVQILWLDENKKIVYSSANHYAATSAWQDQRLLVTGPAGATQAYVSLATASGEIWVDNVSFGPYE
jgi:4-amino-4-deoxy-L-arabinose transferase-like glycosyltransferase